MFKERREKFMQEMGDGGVALFFAAPERTRSNDTNYKYRQESYFHYLTGFHEPGAAALLMPGHPRHRFVMFVRPRNRERETWDGRRAGPEGAKELFGADAAHEIDRLAELLPEYLENVDRFFYSMGGDTDRDALVFAALEKVKAKVRQGIKAPSMFLDPSALLNEMRLVKSEDELDRMKTSGRECVNTRSRR
jgi:Xaa-Pro aminopeptidase